MFYTVWEQGLRLEAYERIGEDQIVIGYLTPTELAEYEKVLDLSKEVAENYRYEQASFGIGLEIHDRFSFGMIQIINIHNVNKDCARLAFYMKKDMFLFVELKDPGGQQKEKFCALMEQQWKNATFEKVVFGIFESFLADGNAMLEETEQTIMVMERRVVEGNIDKNLNKRIFQLKRQLTIQKNYYQQLSSIGIGLLENENHIFEQEDFRYFKLFSDKAERLSRNTQLLCEDLVHVREALDAALDYNLNSIMKVFTVVTTIFMPLTLITGWYGMNFTHMPELAWKFGYPAVIIISLLVIAFCLFFFKWKKLL